MLSIQEFFRAHKEALHFLPDPEKLDAIEAPPDATLYLVAGPGTGKTACLAARVLKLIFVDDVPADGIVATTFTVKAAAELRSRILDWGFRLGGHIEQDDRLSKAKRLAAGSLDVNQLVTGTIDSLCQDMLVRYRDPGTQPPVLIDEFVSRTLLLRHGLFGDARFRSRRLPGTYHDMRGHPESAPQLAAGPRCEVVSPRPEVLDQGRLREKVLASVQLLDQSATESQPLDKAVRQGFQGASRCMASLLKVPSYDRSRPRP